MTNGRFKILLRRMQIQAPYPTALDPVVPVIVHCAPLTGFAEYIPGTVDNTTPFEDITPVDGWYDFSGMSKEGHQYIEPDFKLSFTWDKTNSGDSTNSTTTSDGSNYDKGVTSDFTFFDGAFRFIYNWLLNTECQILNCVEVKIIDLIARANNPDPAGNYRIFEIKSDNIEWMPIEEPCQFHIKLREQDTIWHCIHKTAIYDDWQGWFKSGGKDHPTFMTCIEPRPRLVNSARMALTLLLYSSIDLVTSLFGVLGLVFKRWILQITTDDLLTNARQVLGIHYVDAPLVQTYVQNVAGKCAMTTDTIFDAGKPFENVCLYFPQAGFMYENDTDTISPSQAFTYDNRWLITIAELFDKLKVVFAAEWYVTPNNQIVFKHIKDLLNLAPIYDFTAPGAEPFYDLKYSFNGTKKPAYGNYQYIDDGSDLASQEMSTLYSDIVDYDGPANNPMLEGERIKNFEFAPTGFVRDGRSKDYLKLLVNDGKIGAYAIIAVLGVIIISLLAGTLTATGGIALAAFAVLLAGIIAIKSSDLKEEFVDNPVYNGSVRLTCEQTLQPRLLLWDGISLQRAKTEARVGLPIPNPYYNPALTPYNEKNQINTDHSNDSGIVYNYPLYFDGDYYDNLYPLYHDPIDNPLKSLDTHQDVTFNVDLCPGMLNLFGVFQDQYAQIGKIVKLETRDNYDVFVRIGNINVDYDADGGKITIKGIVIRRKKDQVDTENEGNIPVVTPEESGPPGPQPGDICYRWRNDSGESSTVTYRDCSGVVITDAVIVSQGTFCAFDIISISGGNIIASDTCVESGSGSGSGSGSSGAGTCNEFMNVITQSATGVSYIDCDGNLVAGVEIPFMGTFCALEIVNYGSCGSIVQVGPCPTCEPCCKPTLINVSVQTTECNPVALELALDDGFVGVPYYMEFPVTGTQPISVDIITAPSWMFINNVDNGDGTFSVVFSGTPDSTGDPIEVDFILTNCAGSFEVDTFFAITDLGGSFFITQQGIQTSGHFATFEFDGMAAGQTGNVVWGDGSAAEAFNSGGGGAMILTHTYARTGTYNQTFVFDANSVITNFINDAGGVINSFSHSDNFTNLSRITLSGVKNIANVLPPAASHITWVDYIGHSSSTITTVDLSTLNSLVTKLNIEQFPNLETISNIPTTVSSVLNIRDNPALTSIDYTGTVIILQLVDNNLPASQVMLANAGNFGSSSINQNFSVSDVNDILVYYDSFGTSGHTLQLDETPDAPPSGAGATAKSNLQGRGWTVFTD